MPANSGKKIVLSAIQITNSLTIGNYLGALKNWNEMQNEHDCLFFAVDMHSITTPYDPETLKQNTYEAIALMLAIGIDPVKSLVFIQSHVPEHAELAWILTCNSSMGELSRMTQYKDKKEKHGKRIPTGLFVYPALMAADILLYQTDLVPVGADQKQHIELARDLAEQMNSVYGGGLFNIPTPLIPKIGAKIMSLKNPTQKMSKSDTDPTSCVYLTDSDKEIIKKVKRAVTDSGSEITYDDDKPGVKNLLNIQAVLTGKTPEALVNQYAGKQYGHLKVETADILVQTLRPIREKANLLLTDKNSLDKILKTGAEKARVRAAKTMKLVYEKIGFISKK